jgi:hypothetical protein
MSADIAFGLLTGFLLGALAGMSLEAGLNQTAWEAKQRARGHFRALNTGLLSTFRRWISIILR